MYKAIKQKKSAIEIVLLICASACVLIVGLITLMIFIEGLPLFKNVGVLDFLFGQKWAPTAKIPSYGILPMILASFYVTLLALVIAIPIGLGVAIFLSEMASSGWNKVMRRSIEVLAGIPSVVYGFFGLVIIVPFIRDTFHSKGYSILAGGIILAIMILPTIISISENAIRSVPSEYKDGSLAMGASHWQTIYRVLVPAARSGILASIVLGTGRAIGETMAIILVMGSTPILPKLLEPARTLTINIVLEMSYVSQGSAHYHALFATAIVLFIFIMLINSIVSNLSKKAVMK